MDVVENILFKIIYSLNLHDFQIEMKKIVVPDVKCRRLAFYLAMEEYVARCLDCEAFFLWRVSPTVIIGRNQILENEVNLEYCAANDVDICRRKSGGGCVYSDSGNLMISYVSRRGDVSEVFEKYLMTLTDALRDLGLDAVWSGRNDILVEGHKVSGNALHQLPDRSIVHGTLLYDTDLDSLTEAIRPPVEKLKRHGVGSVRQRVTNLVQYKGLDPALESMENLEKYLTGRFTDGEVVLGMDEVALIEEISNDFLIH